MIKQVKIFAVSLLSLIFMLSSAAVPVLAGDRKSLKLGVSADRSSYADGNTVVLTLAASDFQNINTGVYGFQVNVQYDSASFDFVAGSEALLQDKTTGSLSVNGSGDALSVVFYDDAQTAPMNYMTAGSLISLSFKVKDGAPQAAYTFSVASADFADNDIEDQVDVDLSAAAASVNVQTKALTGISLSSTSATILKGKTQTLTVGYIPADTTDTVGTPVWESSDSTVATVAGGVVTGVKAGTAAITARVNGFSATCAVTVEEKQLASISLNKTSLSLAPGGTEPLSVSLTPADTTDTIGPTAWSSSNQSVATVDNAGRVTAVGAGSAVVTASVNGLSATCQVTVAAPSLTGIALDRTSASMNIGDSLALTPSFVPSGAADASDVVWSSSDEAVATVSEDGAVTAVSAGSAVITASVGSLSAACSITVVAGGTGVPGGTSSTPGSASSPAPSKTAGAAGPSTGDAFPALWVPCLLLASLAAGAAVFYRRKKLA